MKFHLLFLVNGWIIIIIKLCFFSHRQAISNDERIKSGLDFLYDAPPGFNKGNKEIIGLL